MIINEYYLIKLSGYLLWLDKNHKEVIYCYDILCHDENDKKYLKRLTFTLNDIDNMIKKGIIEPHTGAVCEGFI